MVSFNCQLDSIWEHLRGGLLALLGEEGGVNRCGKTQPDWEQDYSLKIDHGLYKMEKVGTKNCSLVCFLAVDAMQPAIWSSYLTSLP